ncbi:oleate activated transcription factor [Acrasis kona]|uniref:Oleate activated transcription factor n=1 Tax=Acrasis kona TaxID=1008807 RepID=A0AAW2ZIE8_9EUKA
MSGPHENCDILIDHRFPIACLDCKNCHRKCDRQFPTCGYCEKKGKTCVYANRRKVVRRVAKQSKKESTGIEVNVLLPETPPRLDVEPSRELPVYNNVAQVNIEFFLPILSYEELVYNFKRINEPYLNMPPLQKDEQAVTYALMGNCYKRLGKHQEADVLLTNARESLSTGFEEVDYNYNIAATFALLADNMITTGNSLHAAFYHRNVKSYLEVPKTEVHPREHYLRFLVTHCEDMIMNNINLLKRFLLYVGLFNVRPPFQHNQNNTDTYIDPALLDDLILQAFGRIDRSPSANINGRVLRLNIVACAQGSKLQHHKTAGILNDSLIYVANSITSLVSDPQFHLVCLIVSVALVEASSYQMDYMSRSNVFLSDILEKLKINYKGLTMLSAKYPIVNNWFSQFMSKLGACISFWEETNNKNNFLRQQENAALSIHDLKYELDFSKGPLS